MCPVNPGRQAHFAMTIFPSSETSRSFLDDRPLSGLQVRALLLCAIVAMLDGNDTQIIGIGAPAIAAALHVAPSAMGWVISGSWAGAALGAVLLGGIGDRVGRKPMIITAVLLFGAFTLLTPLADNVRSLVIIRVLACVGLGGATPCVLSLASEYVPARRRATAVSLVYAAFPLGILIGSLLNGWLLSRFPWRVIFYVGGAAPIAVSLILAMLLPESVGWLLARRPGGRQTARITAAAAPGLSPTAARNANGPAAPASGMASPLHLFRSGRAWATLCLWVVLFACFGITASTVWLPTILQEHGVSSAAAAVSASFVGLGSLIGFVAAGPLIDRFGLVRALVAPIVAGAAATAALGIWPGSAQAESIFVALVGALVGLGVSGGVSVVAWVYPTALRSTGAGWAMGLGRAGQVTVPGVFAILLHKGWAAQAIFAVLGSFALVAAVGALLLAAALRTNGDVAVRVSSGGLAVDPFL